MHCSQVHSWDILWGDYETPKGKSYFVYRYLHRQMPLIMIIYADSYEKRHRFLLVIGIPQGFN